MKEENFTCSTRQLIWLHLIAPHFRREWFWFYGHFCQDIICLFFCCCFVLKCIFSFPFTFAHITNKCISHRQFMDSLWTKFLLKPKNTEIQPIHFTLMSFRELIDLSEPWMQLCDWANGTLCAALLSHQHFCSYTGMTHANISPHVRQLKGSLWSISSWDWTMKK